MTPAAFCAFVRGAVEREKTEIETLRTTAYSLAVMVRYSINAKHMPDYEKFFPKKQAPMTDEQMYAQVEALNKAMGGTVTGE